MNEMNSCGRNRGDDVDLKLYKLGDTRKSPRVYIILCVSHLLL